MFAKPYKTKAHNSLKGSARKCLVQKIKAAFPALSEDDLKELVPLKAPLSHMKVTTSAGDDVGLHIVDSIPIMMEMFDVLYPTVYAMWRCPHMLPSLTIFNTVASKFSEGNYHVSRGHLFIPPRGTRLPSFSKGSLVSVNMTDNKAAILVGVANYSTGDLPQVVRGQCVKTLQMFGDLLCKFEKFTRLERPKLGLPYMTPEESETVTEELSKMILNDDEPEDNESSNIDNNENTTEDQPDTNSSETSPEDFSGVDEHGFPVDMDRLLEYCLLCVLKTEGKKIVLPLKTNLLYANHMTTFCPSERTLDVKKSSFKKMAKFLEAMEKDGLLQVKPLEKGVDAVVGVNFAHPSIKSHSVITETQSGVKLGNKKPTDEDLPTFSAPGVKEMYKITAAVLPLFEKQNYKRGDALTASQASNALVAYVRRNNLQNADNKNLVNVDPLLAHITPADVTISWEDLKACILKKMTNCTEMTFADGSSTINTGKLPMITMQVANRSGNKKVTLVSNLHYYGISLAALSKECQHGVAASCSITKSAGSKFDQLLVQGNQTYFLAKHLTEFYKLPKRFIEGAEKALASKKK